MSSVPPQTRTIAGSLSPVVAKWLKQAHEALARKDLGAATDLLDRVLRLAPTHPDALRLAGVTAQMRGDHARAIGFLQRALELVPDDAPLRMAVGISQFELGESAAAIVSLRRACMLAPESAPAWFNYGKALKLDVRIDDAIEVLHRALSLDPGHVSARLTLADALASLGRIPAAVVEYRNVLKRQPEHPRAWFALANMKTVPLDQDDLATLERAAVREDIQDVSRNLLEFALAHALESQGNYPRAFEVFRLANAGKRARIQWNAAAQHAKVDAIQHAFARRGPEPADPGFGHEAILIASIPRSGSTLVEQILASHPDVEGTNEILDLPQVVEAESNRRGVDFPEWVSAANDDDWRRLGEDYLARTARWRARRPRFTDKNLLIWELVGAALAMLPGARVVVCRRDPVETCLACYRQWFANGAEFSYDLDEMADYYIDFMRLTRFWLERFPDRVFDLEYESLVADPEETTRKLLDFCDLPFDPACLEFHKTARTVLSAASAAQVRQPLRRDTARAVRYGDKLDQLRKRLRDAGLVQ